MGFKIIITGASGMVGEGAVLRCIVSNKVESILVLGRRPCGIQHPKVQEILVPDFRDLSNVRDQLRNYDAIFFCSGVSSVGMDEARYSEVTYDTTLSLAHELVAINPQMSFMYVSGAGTDSSEKGSSMWARVKGRTENALMSLGFAQVLAIRPGYLHPIPGARHVLSYYKYISWLYPIVRTFFPKHASTLQEVADAMINAITAAPKRAVLEVPDLVKLASN